MNKIKLLILTLFIIAMTPMVSLASSTVHRALLIGNLNYKDGNNLLGPTNDLIKVEKTMQNNFFGENNNTFSDIAVKKDLTRGRMIESIRTTFKDAKETDVSYFYYSGHGYYSPTTLSSHIVGIDGKGLDVHELERELSKIPGKIVIILDSCNSGGFINRSIDQPQITSFNEKYNDSVIDAFTSSKSRSYLTMDKYKVLTASSKDEVSYEYKYPDGWGGGFTRVFVEGTGFNGSFLSDKNSDGDITLSEIYDYTKGIVKDSNVQVYPNQDGFVIASSFKEVIIEDKKNVLNWPVFYDISLDKVWKVNFNQTITDSDWSDKVYIMDSYGNKISTKVTRNEDGKSLNVKPLQNYKIDNQYNLWIQDNIYSQSGNRHKDKVLVNFHTINR